MDLLAANCACITPDFWGFALGTHRNSSRRTGLRVPTPPGHSGKVLHFFLENSRTWKVRKITLVLESPGKYPRKSCIFLVVQMENKHQQCSSQFVLTVAYLNTVWNVDEFCHLCCEFFSLYLNIHGLRKGTGKFFMGVPESPGFFFSTGVGSLLGDFLAPSAHPTFRLCPRQRQSPNPFRCSTNIKLMLIILQLYIR